MVECRIALPGGEQVRTCKYPLQDKLLQVPLDDHILYGTHCDLEQVCICGIREMAVDLLFRVAVERAKLVHEVLAGLHPVIRGAVVVGEAVVGDRALCQLLLEQIHLVEEKNERRFGEPMRVGNRLPEHERLVHLVLTSC